MTIYQLIIVLSGCVGAVLTYMLQYELKLNAVKASALVSLPVALFFYFNLISIPVYFSNNIPAVIFGASFAGMVSKKVLYNYWLVSLSGIIFSIIYLKTSIFFKGYGGTLGTSACIAVVITYGIQYLLRKLN